MRFQASGRTPGPSKDGYSPPEVRSALGVTAASMTKEVDQLSPAGDPVVDAVLADVRALAVYPGDELRAAEILRHLLTAGAVVALTSAGAGVRRAHVES